MHRITVRSLNEQKKNNKCLYIQIYVARERQLINCNVSLISLLSFEILLSRFLSLFMDVCVCVILRKNLNPGNVTRTVKPLIFFIFLF